MKPIFWTSVFLKNIMTMLLNLLEKTGHSKRYLPLIPESLFSKGSRHLRGFGNQVFWVTRVGKRRTSRKLSATLIKTSRGRLGTRCRKTLNVSRNLVLQQKRLEKEEQFWQCLSAGGKTADFYQRKASMI